MVDIFDRHRLLKLAFIALFVLGRDCKGKTENKTEASASHFMRRSETDNAISRAKQIESCIFRHCQEIKTLHFESVLQNIYNLLTKIKHDGKWLPGAAGTDKEEESKISERQRKKLKYSKLCVAMKMSEELLGMSQSVREKCRLLQVYYRPALRISSDRDWSLLVTSCRANKSRTRNRLLQLIGSLREVFAGLENRTCMTMSQFRSKLRNASNWDETTVLDLLRHSRSHRPLSWLKLNTENRHSDLRDSDLRTSDLSDPGLRGPGFRDPGFRDAKVNRHFFKIRDVSTPTMLRLQIQSVRLSLRVFNVLESFLPDDIVCVRLTSDSVSPSSSGRNSSVQNVSTETHVASTNPASPAYGSTSGDLENANSSAVAGLLAALANLSEDPELQDLEAPDQLFYALSPLFRKLSMLTTVRTRRGSDA